MHGMLDLAPYRRNPGLFQIIFQYMFDSPGCFGFEKVPDLSLMWQIWPSFGTNMISLVESAIISSLYCTGMSDLASY